MENINNPYLLISIQVRFKIVSFFVRLIVKLLSCNYDTSLWDSIFIYGLFLKKNCATRHCKAQQTTHNVDFSLVCPYVRAVGWLFSLSVYAKVPFPYIETCNINCYCQESAWNVCDTANCRYIYFWTSPNESAPAKIQLFAHYGPLDFIDLMVNRSERLFPHTVRIFS